MKVWLHNQYNAMLARKLARQWRGRRATSFDFSRANRVLIIELGGLGDAVTLLPVLEALRRHAPSAEFSVVCRDYVAGLFELAIPTARVVGISKSRDGVEKAVAAFGDVEWDTAMATCWSSWTTLLAMRLRTKTLTGFWQPWCVESFGFSPPNPPRITRDDHLELLRFKAASTLGVSIPNELPPPRLVPRESDWESARRKHPALEERISVFIPFSDDRGKTLNHGEAMLALAALADVPNLWLLGGSRETQALNNFIREEKMATDLSVGELAAVLARARWVVSVDTGALHVATAVGARSIGIYKVTEPRLCAPIGLTQAIKTGELPGLGKIISG